MPFDHILVIGFGGPTQPDEIWPFLQNVTRGIPIPEERLRSVEHHYHAVGGRSPYNEYTFRLLDKLREKLSQEKIFLPVFVGMRNWHPLMTDTLREIKQQGLKRGIGVILAPHRSDASYEKYIRTVEEAKKNADAEIEYVYLKPWFDHAGFISAQADEIQKVLDAISESDQKKVPLIFTAHSIPLEMAEKSHYAEEVRISCELVIQQLGMSNWQLAWQSRSGNPRQPWLEPDVNAAIRYLHAKAQKQFVIVPIGFLCDNVEVLFDLDTEAREESEKLGIKYWRASTVMDHPKFVAMFAELIEEILEDSNAQSRTRNP